MIKQLSALLLAGALAGVPALDAPALPEMGSELGLAASGIAQVEDTLYVADSYQRGIWKIDGDQAERLTGSNENLDQNGRPLTGYLDGDMEKALFGEPWAVIPYLDGLRCRQPCASLRGPGGWQGVFGGGLGRGRLSGRQRE